MLVLQARTISILALILAVGCTTGEIDDSPLPTPPDSSTPPDQNPPPEPEPTPLTVDEVQSLVNAAVAGSFGESQTGVQLARAGNTVTLTGSYDGAGGVVSFTGLSLDKTPFTATGRVTVTARDQDATMDFAQSTVAAYSINGAEIGSIELSMPAIDEFVDTTVSYLLGLALDCQGLDLNVQQLQIVLNESCTATGENGQQVGSLVVDNVTVDLLNQAVSGTIELTAPGVVVELVLDGQNVTVVVNGNEVANVTVADLVQLLL